MRIALDYARSLDAMLPNADFAQHDALINVGELLGGLSCNGFHDDLMAVLDDVEGEDRLLNEAWLANDWWMRARAIMAAAEAPALLVAA